MLDEAHAVLGPTSTSHPTPTCCASARCSKTSARSAGSSPGPARYVELVENSSRPYIFTTAPTPADTAAALAALRVLRSPEGRRARRAAARERRPAPRPATRRRSCRSCAATEQRAVAAAAALLEHGLIVPAIRPPTVAPGTSRLRVTLSAAHTDAHVDRLLAALADVFGDALAPTVSA